MMHGMYDIMKINFYLQPFHYDNVGQTIYHV
jgi:hypothetical protein